MGRESDKGLFNMSINKIAKLEDKNRVGLYDGDFDVNTMRA